MWYLFLYIWLHAAFMSTILRGRNVIIFSWLEFVSLYRWKTYFLLWNIVQRKRSQVRTYTHPYEHTHAQPTPMSASKDRVAGNWFDGSWDWRSHHGRLAVDGNITSYWKNISPFYKIPKRQTWDLIPGGLGVHWWKKRLQSRFVKHISPGCGNRD
jgi:hypothetical protein